MKRKLWYFVPLLLLILALFPMSALAEEYSGQCGDDVYYTYSENGRVITISGTGDMWDFDTSVYTRPWTRGDGIDTVYVKRGVTSIGSNAFSEMHLISLSLPIGLKSIGESAFANSDLVSVTFPASLTTIEAAAFIGNTELVSITFTDGIKHIGEFAFCMCESLNNVTLPSTIESIGYGAFSMCSSLTNSYYDGSRLDWMLCVDMEGYNGELEDSLVCANEDETPESAGWYIEDGFWRLVIDGQPGNGWYHHKTYWYYLDNGFMVQNKVIDDNGAKYYLGIDGRWVTTPGTLTYTNWIGDGEGNYTSRNVTILIGGSGLVITQHGWQKVNNKWYYIGDNDEPLQWRVAVIDGEGYYFGSDGAWVTTPGWMETAGYTDADGNYYPRHIRVGNDGRLLSGWSQLNDLWLYLIPGAYVNASGGIYPIDGTFYYFDNAGFMQTGEQEVYGKTYDFGTTGALKLTPGWHEIGYNWYYANADGSLKNGWLQDGGNWYYLDKEYYYMHTTEGNFFEEKIDGKVYFFDEHGVMKTNYWRGIPYFDEETGDLMFDWYYHDASGALVTGWKQISGSWYYFATTFENNMYLIANMVTDWQQIDGKWYYFGSDGAMRSGWQQIGGSWYYFNNTMVTGWKQINGTWYYFGSDGAMKSGWQQIDGKWYYFNNTMVTGWKQISGSWYYFGSDGAMKSGWQQIGGSWYYLNNAMVTGWKQINGTWYYFKSSGAMASGETLTIDGKSYSFAANGAWIS